MNNSSNFLITEISVYVKQYVRALRAVLDEDKVRVDGVRALSREIGISRSLANAVYVLVNEQGHYRHIAILPASRGLKTIYKALSLKSSATNKALPLLLQAETDLHKFLKLKKLSHNNMQTLNVADHDQESNKEYFENVYKDSFRSSCAIWGMNAEAIVRTCFVFESEDFEDSWSSSSITHVLGLQRLREGPSVPIFVPLANGSVVDPFIIRGSPIASEAPCNYLMQDYCSEGLLKSEITHAKFGSNQVIIFGNSKSNRVESLDICAGDFMDDTGSIFAENDTDRFGSHLYSIRIPSKTLVLELLLPKKMKDWGQPTAHNFGTQLHYGQAITWDESMQLPLHYSLEQVSDLYSLPPIVERISEKHKNAIEEVLCEHKTTLEDFECYRLTFSHPPLNSLVVMQWELSQKT